MRTMHFGALGPPACEMDGARGVIRPAVHDEIGCMVIRGAFLGNLHTWRRPVPVGACGATLRAT